MASGGVGSYGCFDASRFPKGTTVGNYCSIASGVRYLNGNHPMAFASTHPLFCNPALGAVKKDKVERKTLTIGNDVWIGYGVTILNGCTFIGNGAVIGAGSVVTKNIDAYGIYAGNPARLIRYRFPKQIQDELEKSKWYEEQPEFLKLLVTEAESPEAFLSKYNEMKRK